MNTFYSQLILYPCFYILLIQLLHFNQHERLGSGIDGSEAIKAHPFFSDINWNSVENQ